MKLSKLLALFVLSFALVLTSCEEDTSDPIDNTLDKPAAPTELMATSFMSDDGETIKLRWLPSASEGTANFSNYELTILNENNSPVGNVINVNATDNPYMVDPILLDPGAVYTFELRAVNADKASDVTSISWSPAWRFVEESTGIPLELYGSQSGFGSGLDLYNDADQGPLVLTVGSGDDWNLAFDDKNGNLHFGSASALSYNVTPEDAEVATQVGLVTSLNEMYFDKALNEFTFQKGYLDLKQYNQSIAVIVRVETSAGSGSYNYARVFIDYGPNGFVRDAGTDNQYILVQVSYQAEVDVPYAKIGKAE